MSTIARRMAPPGAVGNGHPGRGDPIPRRTRGTGGGRGRSCRPGPGAGRPAPARAAPWPRGPAALAAFRPVDEHLDLAFDEMGEGDGRLDGQLDGLATWLRPGRAGAVRRDDGPRGE